MAEPSGSTVRERTCRFTTTWRSRFGQNYVIGQRKRHAMRHICATPRAGWRCRAGIMSIALHSSRTG